MENCWRTRVSVVFGLLWLTGAGAVGLSGCGDAAGPVMECESGATRPCGTDQGECVAGLETCVDGEWGPCQGAVGPADEACDGLDNDCDGQTDQGCPCASVTECIDADGCCPAGCNNRIDDDCAPRCSNGVVEAGETCDPPAACPAGCWDGNPCTVDALVGNALDCNVVCSYTVVMDCANADGCCPAGCNSASDDDCSTDCGNGRIDAGETCDPPESCPADCEDKNPCTADMLLGSAANCNVSCSHVPVHNCADADGCCPAGCNSQVDGDCSPTCGNGEIELGETCDPPDICPDTCEEGNPCTVDIRLGNPANCNVTCIHLPVIACSGGDGCCPAGCNNNVDADCSTTCGNGEIESGESCDPPATCPASCDDSNPCTLDRTTGAAENCNLACSHNQVIACESGDGCCPVGCGCADSDCWGPACPEVCDGTGGDEDADGRVDCLDVDCLDTAGCVMACAVAPVAIGCAESLAGDTAAVANAISWYGCIDWDEIGGEAVYGFSVAEPSAATVSVVSEPGADLDLFVLEAACRQDACVAHGDRQVSFSALPGMAYFLVVDGFEGKGGMFGIDVQCQAYAEDCNSGVDDDFDGRVDCADPDCVADPACPATGFCSGRFLVHCNDTRWSRTTNDNQTPTDVIDAYSCSAWDESGPEVAWSFLAQHDTQVSASIEYDPAQTDLDLFVLEGACKRDQCLQAGDESLAFQATAGITYYLVVDGRGGDYGDYILRVLCDEMCDNSLDDDADGLTDCADPECRTDAACAGEHCLTGFDEDGDGLTDCADPDCAGTNTCPASGQCYPFSQEIKCGDAKSLSTAAWAATDVVDAYACTAEVLAGPENALRFRAHGAGPAAVTLTSDSTGGLLQVAVLEDACQGTACVAHGADGATFAARDGHEYYIVVDAPEGVAGAFGLRIDCQYEDCYDFQDNDGDLLVDCDDPDCASTAWCPPGICQPDGAIGCEQNMLVSTIGEPNEVMYYPGCGPSSPTDPGGEAAYLFTTDTPVQVSAMFRPLGPGAGWLLVLEGECSGTSCLMRGGGGVVFLAAPGRDYYLVIDGIEGGGDFELQTHCAPASEVCVNGVDDDGNGLADCDDPACSATAACPADGRCQQRPEWFFVGCDQQRFGESYTWATDVIDGYACSAVDASGPEFAYTFMPDANATVTVELSHPAGYDLDLFVLQAECLAAACIAAGDTTVQFPALKDRTYNLVIDGRNGAAGNFEIQTHCAY